MIRGDPKLPSCRRLHINRLKSKGSIQTHVCRWELRTKIFLTFSRRKLKSARSSQMLPKRKSSRPKETMLAKGFFSRITLPNNPHDWLKTFITQRETWPKVLLTVKIMFHRRHFYPEWVFNFCDMTRPHVCMAVECS